LIRNQKVILDSHLAEFYQVETKVLKQSVKPNLIRLTEDFMFELIKVEFENLRSQIVTSSWGGSRYLPLVFTEQGIAMLSSVLSSHSAIAANIKIIRIFKKMRALLADNLNLRLEIGEIKKKVTNQSKNIELVFSYLDELIDKKENKTKRTKIEYKKIRVKANS
jgi:hypothetical protein